MVMITVASFKGGVGKTTAAVHVAALLSSEAPTILVDGDPNRSATAWSDRGEFPFAVMDEFRALREVQKYTHSVVDTKARPEPDDFRALAQGTDLLIVPSPPSALDIDALMLTIRELAKMGCRNYRVLLNIVPRSTRSVPEARQMLESAGIPIFRQDISALEAFRTAALEGCLVDRIRDSRAQRAWEEYSAVYTEIRDILGW
jgi:chromosome partitioning protein